MMNTDNAVSLNSPVTLNVGGTPFVTTRQTLLGDPDSMLANMFDPESPLQPGETSTLSLSRDYVPENQDENL